MTAEQEKKMNDATLAKAMCFSCTAVPFPGKIKTLKCGVYFWKEVGMVYLQ